MLIQVSKLVSLEKDPTFILDAGCGTGNMSVEIENQAQGDRAVVIGIDSSPAMLARAKSKPTRTSFRLANLDERLPFSDGYFNAIVCVNVIYAVPNPSRTIGELLRVLDDGGTLVVTSPKSKPSMGKILNAHIRAEGYLSLLPLLLPLIAVAVFNLVILRRGQRGTYHFFDEDQLQTLFGQPVEILSTYADQNWLVRFTKPISPRMEA
jgi:ubiquinone/menaquinone biosynthesis C-methylase UbiE